MGNERIKVIQPFKIKLYYRTADVSKIIHFYFSLHGKRYRESSRTNHLQTAEEYAIQRYLAIKSQGKEVKKVFKLEKVVDKFMAWKKPFVSERTFSEYTRQVKTLIEKFQGKDIEKFTIKDYHEYDEWRRAYYEVHKRKRVQTYVRNGKKHKGCKFKDCGNTTINREVGLLVSILKYSQDVLQLNQAKKIPSWRKLPERVRSDILSREEYERLKAYWLKKNHYYWDIISFIQNTGCRYPSEIKKLTWKDVNFDKSFIIIRERKGKPNRDMSIPLVGTAKEILERLKARPNIPTGPEDLVFLNEKGKQVRNIRTSFRKSLVACGIDNPRITMYSLRHLYTTRMLLTRPDIPHKVLAEALGHRDTKMMDKVYGHLMIDGIVKIFEKSEANQQETKKQEKADEEKERMDKAIESWFPMPQK
ncbi:MAG: tyrosine-type recombinase/integrase [Desulfobaccales bacterium]